MKVFLKGLGIILLLFALLNLFLILTIREPPPLHIEYEKIADEIYNHYINFGSLPKYDNLSYESKKVIDDPNGITYSLKNGLCYTYDKKYSQEQSTIFSTPISESYTPKDLKNNAGLRKKPPPISK